MPAKFSLRTSEGGTYCHIYNKGVDNKVIFNEEKDYLTFLLYLSEYLSPPPDPETAKKDFLVKGRVYRGIPHQPKNYFNQVELVAYCLKPKHFSLVLHQKSQGSVAKFIRSFSTRYSIYYNKKYHRSGTLFEGSYKSAQIKNISALNLLTRHLHRSGGCSSYPDYLQTQKTPWIKPQAVLLSFDNNINKYRNFVEKEQIAKNEEDLLKEIIFEKENTPTTQSIPINEKAETKQEVKTRPQTLELALMSLVFFLLLGLGIRNINAVNTNISSQSASKTDAPDVLSESDTTDEAITQELKKETMPTITINSTSNSISIYQEPSTASGKIGTVINGEIYEFISINSPGWYEIKLDDNLSGFIFAPDAKINDKENNLNNE